MRRRIAMAEPATVAVGFARCLRSSGVPVATSEVVDFAAALGLLGVASRRAVLHAGRATLVRRPEDLAAYDAAFAAFFEGRHPQRDPRPSPPTPAAVALDDPGDGPPGPGDDAARTVRWSAAEVLAGRDLASLDDDEWAAVGPLLTALRVSTEVRRSRRTAPGGRRGQLDTRATLRRSLRTGGLALDPAHRRRLTRPRRLVLLADVSGSMEPYARACLRFAHAAVTARRAGGVEVFAVGTRLTRLTRSLAWSDPDVALAAAAAEVVDWSGGTRLGEGLAAFNDRWGVAGMARGAVVVILSDGWDRGDPERLGVEMGRLHRVAHRVVWVNPLKAGEGYAPLARGMAAALPHVDDFVEGHSLAALRELATVVGGGRSR
jgi:uncharacterized protein with von Willebrand factor type A (vWA) domain